MFKKMFALILETSVLISNPLPFLNKSSILSLHSDVMKLPVRFLWFGFKFG